jgi:Rrf2 family transcriptional regulator, cysteine metabolism repressor
MRLSFRSEYALLALVYLAHCDGEKYVPVRVIAQTQSIPPKYLEQILLTLKRASYLRSLKGQGGGYALSKPPEQISLAEVIRLFDGPLAPTGSASVYFYESTPIEKNPRLLQVFQEIRGYLADKLEHLTLADL